MAVPINIKQVGDTGNTFIVLRGAREIGRVIALRTGSPVRWMAFAAGKSGPLGTFNRRGTAILKIRTATRDVKASTLRKVA